MNRLEELTLKLVDAVLSECEAAELAGFLAQNAAVARSHVGLLRVEASLRGRRKELPSADLTLARLRQQTAEDLSERILREIKAAPAPEWQRLGHRATAREGPSSRAGQIGLFRMPKRRLALAWPLALAAGLALLFGLRLWYFGPTMGKAVLAEVRGNSVFVERGTEMVPGAAGLRLQRADVLHTGNNASAVIGFGSEKTRLDVAEGSELTILSQARGKQLHLRLGTIQASVARQRPFEPMSITTPNAQARVIGTAFSLTVTTNTTRLDVSEGRVRFTGANGRQQVDVPKDYYATAAAGVALSALPQTGGILREYWTNLPGLYVRKLETDPRFPSRPDGRQVLKDFEAPTDWADNYGARFRGYVHPPVSGVYQFWIAGSGEFFLDLSENDDPADKVRVCYGTKTGPREWDRGGRDEQAQRSSPIFMQAGRIYYIEALHKAAIGSDHLAVAWRVPGGEREVIPGKFLSPFVLGQKGGRQ